MERIDNYYAKDVKYFRDRVGFSSVLQPLNKNEKIQIMKAVESNNGMGSRLKFLIRY